MIGIDIPGGVSLRLEHLVLDYNGTLAVDGEIMPGVVRMLNALSERLQVHVVTADTFGSVRANLAETACQVHVIEEFEQDRQKLDYIKSLGSDGVVCVGNGKNDLLMLEEAAIGIAVILREGAFAKTMAKADIVCTDILSALELLTHHKRIQATLRT